MNHDHRPLCEQLMVLLLTDDGKPVAATTTGYLLAGALLGDLVVRGRVDLARSGEAVPAGGVLVRSLMPTGDDLLDDALERVRRREGGRPSSVIRPLSKGTRSAVLERSTAAGVVGASTEGCSDSPSGYGRRFPRGPRRGPAGPCKRWSRAGPGPIPRPPC